MPLNLRTDIVPIGQLDWSYNVLVVSPESKYRSLTDLVAGLKANPGKLSYASGGHGTPAHFVSAQMLLQTGTSAAHVRYNQFGQALGDASTGRVDFMVLNAVAAVPQVAASKMRALAVTSPARNPALPATPSFAELGLPQVAVRARHGIIAIKGTPKEAMDRISKEMVAALADPALQRRMIEGQSEPDRANRPGRRRIVRQPCRDRINALGGRDQTSRNNAGKIILFDRRG